MNASVTAFTPSALVRELARAWQKLALYQDGHPAREEVVARPHAILIGLLAPTGTVSLGVIRDGFLAGEDRIAGSTVERLAAALYDRSVAVIRFDEGVTPGELRELLAAVPRWPATPAEPPLWDHIREAGVERIRLEPIDFSRLTATEDLAASDTAEDDGARPRGSLFERILERLVAEGPTGEPAGDAAGARGAAPSDALEEILAIVGRVLERHGIDPVGTPTAGDASAAAALAGLSALLGGSLADAVIAERDAAGRHEQVRYVHELLVALPVGLRDGVLDAALRGLVQEEGTGEAFAGMTGSIAAADVIASLRRLRHERVPFSSRVVGFVDDLLLRDAGTLSAANRVGQAPDAGELRTLFAEAERYDAVPGQHRRDRLALELRRRKPAVVAEPGLDPRLETLTPQRVLVQVAGTLVDLLPSPALDVPRREAVADRLEAVLQTLLASGRLKTALRVLEDLQRTAGEATASAPARLAAESFLLRVRGSETLASVVEGLAGLAVEEVGLLRRVVDLLGTGVVRDLLLALCEETDLGRRRHTFDLVAALGSTVAAPARDLLHHERWYVTRNMLALLRRIGEPLEAVDLAALLRHGDSRVRLEAVKSLGATREAPSSALLRTAVEDDDPKVSEAAATAIGLYRLEAGRTVLVDLLKRPDPLARRTATRIKALGALAELGDPAVLDDIAHMFRTWLGSVTAVERRAAFASLAGYPPKAREPWLRRGLRAPDAEVRSTCRALAAEDRR